MNNVLKQLINTINEEAFKFAKKQYHKVLAIKHRHHINNLLKEVERMRNEFSCEGRDDVYTKGFGAMVLKEDCPELRDLTNYLRCEYGKNFPKEIDVYSRYSHTEFKLIAVGEHIGLPHCISISNQEGKFYTYAGRTVERYDYDEETYEYGVKNIRRMQELERYIREEEGQ